MFPYNFDACLSINNRFGSIDICPKLLYAILLALSFFLSGLFKYNNYNLITIKYIFRVIVNNNKLMHKYLKSKNKKLSFDEQLQLLFDYCNTHKEISKANTKYKGYNIGHW
eukprot:364841_1